MDWFRTWRLEKSTGTTKALSVGRTPRVEMLLSRDSPWPRMDFTYDGQYLVTSGEDSELVLSVIGLAHSGLPLLCRTTAFMCTLVRKHRECDICVSASGLPTVIHVG